MKAKLSSTHLLTTSAASLALLALLAFPGDAFASGKSKSKANAKEAVKTEAANPKVVVTGSRMPQAVNGDKNGKILATASPVTVLDQKTIQRSGHVTVAGLLGSQAAFR